MHSINQAKRDILIVLSSLFIPGWLHTTGQGKTNVCYLAFRYIIFFGLLGCIDKVKSMEYIRYIDLIGL